MIRLLSLAVLFTVGCGRVTSTNDLAEPDLLMVNGVQLATGFVNSAPPSLNATWNSNFISVQNVSDAMVPDLRSTIDGIVRMVRNTGADRDCVPFTVASKRWPTGTTIYGVTRGIEDHGFRQGQFVIQSPFGNIFLTVVAERSPIPFEELAAFLEATTIAQDAFHFPVDHQSATMVVN